MQTISTQIRELVAIARPKLMHIRPEDARQKPGPDSWSKVEILGHLIDSALNNHQRFVRAALNEAEHFPTYQQERWVEVQDYQEGDWEELVEYWARSNLHLCRMLDRMPEKALGNLCNIGKEAPARLDFVIHDYLRHLNLHLAQLIGPLDQ